MDVQEQRVRFVVAASRGEKTMAALCQEFGISRPVGYEWLSRYRQGGVAAPDAQAWLDEFRWEHNHVRPHEALAMRTPAMRWRPSPRRYQPNPPRWEYPQGAKVLKVDSQGKLTLAGANWKISRAVAGEWVQVVRIESRLQVYYCTTLSREIDLTLQRSTMVERWIPLPNEELKV